MVLVLDATRMQELWGWKGFQPDFSSHSRYVPERAVCESVSVKLKTQLKPQKVGEAGKVQAVTTLVQEKFVGSQPLKRFTLHLLHRCPQVLNKEL